jgi:hypothetical protein
VGKSSYLASLSQTIKVVIIVHNNLARERVVTDDQPQEPAYSADDLGWEFIEMHLAC